MLRSRDLRATKIRVAILNALSAAPHARPYGELQAALREFDRTTLYRTLLALVDKGLIHKALEENGERYYALCEDCTVHAHAHQHIHFKCVRCGSVQCVDMEVPAMERLTVPGFSVDHLEVVAHGRCAAC